MGDGWEEESERKDGLGDKEAEEGAKEKEGRTREGGLISCYPKVQGRMSKKGVNRCSSWSSSSPRGSLIEAR